jgi:hypothetical protein
MALSLMLLAALPTVALGVSRGVYRGASKGGSHHMDIAIQVLRGARQANWRIDVFAPCTEHEQLGRTVGTDAGNTPPDPRLQIKAGRFTLKRKPVTNTLSGLTYSYVLTGRSVRGGFAGTFHYAEHKGAYRCDSTVLHWRVHLTGGSFP